MDGERQGDEAVDRMGTGQGPACSRVDRVAKTEPNDDEIANSNPLDLSCAFGEYMNFGTGRDAESRS